MANFHEERTRELQKRLEEAGIDVAVLSEPGTIYYLSGYHSYLGMDFARPTLLVLPRAEAPTLVTPMLEGDMARAMTWIDDIRLWMDGVGGEWTTPLSEVLSPFKNLAVGVERYDAPHVVLEFMEKRVGLRRIVDVSPVVADLRMLKTHEEVAVMRQAGQVAVAMVGEAINAIGEGVPEWEVALAVIQGGTRKAAELLDAQGPDRLVSPTTHNLQILQSGRETTMKHRRSTTRRIQRGDPVFLCFCGVAAFKQVKLGFDREVFVGTVDDEHARLYELAIKAQKAALDAIRPGARAEEVHTCMKETLREAGYEAPYRTGRGIGYSYLEKPQLKDGDTTRLQPGMTVCVDGGVTLPGTFSAQVGDSIVVTEDGFEFLTDYPRDLRVL